MIRPDVGDGEAPIPLHRCARPSHKWETGIRLQVDLDIGKACNGAAFDAQLAPQFHAGSQLNDHVWNIVLLYVDGLLRRVGLPFFRPLSVHEISARDDTAKLE